MAAAVLLFVLGMVGWRFAVAQWGVPAIYRKAAAVLLRRAREIEVRHAEESYFALKRVGEEL